MKIFKFLMSAFIAIVLLAIAIPAKSPPAQHSAVNSVNVPAKNSALEIPATMSERGVYPAFYAANQPNVAKSQGKAKEKILTKWQKTPTTAPSAGCGQTRITTKVKEFSIV